MIVMPPAAAAQIPAFNNGIGWSFLLPPGAGGPTSSQQVRVELPDPTQSATGLATLVEMRRLLGSGAAARTSLTTFVRSAQSSAQFGNTGSLATFVTLASPPLNAHPVTVTSEQAVLGYDAAHPGQPLAARYPAGPGAALGTPELDYPYVVTSTDPAEVTAAHEFGTAAATGLHGRAGPALRLPVGRRDHRDPARWRRAGPADAATGAAGDAQRGADGVVGLDAGCRSARGTSR